MADVTDRVDRGQLILITGLVVALLLVVLVVLLNAVIYTENIGTREVDGDSREPIGFQNEVIEVTGSMIDAENEAEHDDEEFDQVEAAAHDGIVRSNELLSQQYAETGVVAEINTTDDALEDAAIEGHLIRQTDETQDFSVDGPGPHWYIAEDVNDTKIRAFELIIDGAEPEPADIEEAFYVSVQETGDGDEWRLYAYDDGQDIELAVANGTDDPEDPTVLDCSDSDAPTIDLTDGLVDGEPCSGLSWANELDGNYDVEFENGDEAWGTFDATVVGDEPAVEDLPGPHEVEEPYAVPAVYALELDVSFYTADITYEATVRVAPGEPA